jgi:hypothetical protein
MPRRIPGSAGGRGVVAPPWAGRPEGSAPGTIAGAAEIARALAAPALLAAIEAAMVR